MRWSRTAAAPSLDGTSRGWTRNLDGIHLPEQGFPSRFLGAVMRAMPGDALLMVVPVDKVTSSGGADSPPDEPEDYSGPYRVLHRWLPPGPEDEA